MRLSYICTAGWIYKLFCGERFKSRRGNPVFSVDTDGSVSDQIQAVNENGSNITPEMISETISSINNFTSSLFGK